MKTLTLSIVEAGKLLGVGRDASYVAAKRGDLPIVDIGGRRRVPVMALEKLLETGVMPTPAVRQQQPEISTTPHRSVGGRPRLCRTAAECRAVPLHLPIQVELADGRVTLTAVERVAARAHGGEIPFAKVKVVALSHRDGDHANSEAGPT